MYYLAIIRAAERYGKKVILYANGIGPVSQKKNRELVKKAVDNATAITLRDPDSLRELKEMGVTRDDILITADPVFLLNPPEDTRTDAILKENGIPDEPFITVSVRPLDGDGFCESFAKICDEIGEKYDVNVVFVAMQPSRDEEVSKKISSLMKRKAYIVSGAYGATELMGVIGRSRLILSMRLHSIIFAARMATPVVGFVYDPKVEAYLSLLSQPSAGYADNIDVEKAVKAASDILDHRERVVEELSAKRDMVVKLAGKNLDVLKMLK
jgi:polysaccharide pyruvyl transferase CsaB